MVPRKGLEPSHLTVPASKTGASTNSAIWARCRSPFKAFLGKKSITSLLCAGLFCISVVANASPDCVDSLKSFLDERVVSTSELRGMSLYVEEFKALRNKPLAEYFVGKTKVTLPSGSVYEQDVMNAETVALFFKDFDRLTAMRENVEGIAPQFKPWWKKYRDFYVNSGAINNILKKSGMTLSDLHTEIFLQFVAQTGTVQGSGWVKRTLARFKPRALIGTLLIAPSLYILNQLKNIAILGTGVQVYNAYTQPVNTPIVNMAGQAGAKDLAGIAKRVNDWTSSRSHVEATHKDLKNAINEMDTFNFHGMDPEKAKLLWEDFEKNRLYPLLIRNQQALPAHLRDYRAYFRDIVLETPLRLATAASQFDSQYWIHKKEFDALQKLPTLTAAQVAERDLHKEMMEGAEDSIAATLVAWRLTAFLYPEVARDASNETAKKQLVDGYDRFSKFFHFEIYIKHYLAAMNATLKQMDLIYLTENEMVKASDNGTLQPLTNNRGPNAIGKARKISKSKAKSKKSALKLTPVVPVQNKELRPRLDSL